MLALLITEDSECVVLSGDGLAHDLQVRTSKAGAHRHAHAHQQGYALHHNPSSC